jgi:predicted transcriptional regulator of viral defense system
MAHRIFPRAGNLPIDAARSVNVGGRHQNSVMERELPPTLRYLIRRQSGVVSRVQALQAGLSEDMVKFRISSDRWRRIHPGVYATFTGELSRWEHLWAAVLSAGPGAALSHQAAAELYRLLDGQAVPIHVTIPHQRRVAAPPGITVHRSRRADQAVQARAYPPRTTIEETVLDLVHAAKTFDDVCGWVTRAIARELTDEAMLQAAMKARQRLRWRDDLQQLIAAAVGGDHSVLEFRYHRDVERAHGLPESARQVPFTTPDGRRGRRDRVYEPYGVVIELDGRLAHQPEDQWKDKTRDNAAAAAGKQTLRYGWAQVKSDPCAIAAEVARVLRLHGWNGQPRTCSPGCVVKRSSCPPNG